MSEEILIKILNTIKKELSIDLNDEEYAMYLQEKLEKAYTKAKEHNISEEDFISAIKLEIPTFLQNYKDMSQTFERQANNVDSNFGISINFQLIDLFKISDLCSNNNDFVNSRNEYFKSLSMDPRFQGFNYIFPGLEDISLEEINNIKKNILEYVDCITPEWSGKMRMIVDSRKELIVNGRINNNIFNFEYLDKVANFARENDLKLRLHNIIWHSQFPIFLKNASKEEILMFLDTYMYKLNERYSDIIYTVDVLNEIASDTSDNILRDSLWKEKLGDEYYIDVLKLARKNFGTISLAYNEYGEERFEKRKNIMSIVNKIKLKEQAENINLLDVIGIQSHYSNQTTDESIKGAYNEYLTLGKNLQVTEFDVSNDGNNQTCDLQTNRVYRTVLGTASASKVKLINMWGVSSNISWKSKKINNFLDDKGQISIYAKKITKCYSKKNKIIKQNDMDISNKI